MIRSHGASRDRPPRWITASTPSQAAAIAARSVTEARTTSSPGPASSGAMSSSRSTRPGRASLGRIRVPIPPAAPVISTVDNEAPAFLLLCPSHCVRSHIGGVRSGAARLHKSSYRSASVPCHQIRGRSPQDRVHFATSAPSLPTRTVILTCSASVHKCDYYSRMRTTDSALGRLDGLLFFPVTAFGADGSFDPPAYRTHVAARLADGPAAVFAACGTGEFPALAPGEYEDCIRVAAETARAAGAGCRWSPAPVMAPRSRSSTRARPSVPGRRAYWFSRPRDRRRPARADRALPGAGRGDAARPDPLPA